MSENPDKKTPGKPLLKASKFNPEILKNVNKARVVHEKSEDSLKLIPGAKETRDLDDIIVAPESRPHETPQTSAQAKDPYDPEIEPMDEEDEVGIGSLEKGKTTNLRFKAKNRDEACRVSVFVDDIGKSLTNHKCVATYETSITGSTVLFQYKPGYIPSGTREREIKMPSKKRPRVEDSDSDEEDEPMEQRSQTPFGIQAELLDFIIKDYDRPVSFDSLEFSYATFWPSPEAFHGKFKNNQIAEEFVILPLEIRVLVAGYMAGRITDFGGTISGDQGEELTMFVGKLNSLS